MRDDGRGIPEKDLPTLFDGTVKHTNENGGDGKHDIPPVPNGEMK